MITTYILSFFTGYLGILLGFRIPKGNRTSTWAARRLSPAQITYAATDAWACRELFLRFESLGLADVFGDAAPCVSRGA